MCVQYVEMILKGMDCYNFFFQRFDFFVPFTNWCFFFVFKEIFIIYKAFMLNLYQCIQRVFLPHHTCNYLLETKLCLKRYLIRYI